MQPLIRRFAPPSPTRGEGKIHPATGREYVVSVTQQQVLNALAKVRSPRGTALTEAGVLSAVTVNDGKVFFSINVDAHEARAWEDVRAQAEAAVRAVPGVTTAMIALTAERKPGSAPAPQRPAGAQQRPAGGVQPASAHRHP